MGSGADDRLDRPEQEDEQRLREAMWERRSVGICCHDSPDDEAVDPPLRPFHTASPGTPVHRGNSIRDAAAYRAPASTLTRSEPTMYRASAHEPMSVAPAIHRSAKTTRCGSSKNRFKARSNRSERAVDVLGDPT